MQRISGGVEGANNSMVALLCSDYTNVSPLVDWGAGKVFDLTVNGKARPTRKYPVTCICGNVRWLTASDARKARVCYRCSQREKGALGYAAMVARYGEKWAVRHIQAYRLANPSTLERAVALILRDLGLRFSREFWLATKAHGRKQHVYLVDFMVTVNGVDHAVEVNGEWAHSHHARRDRLKLRLLRRRGYPVLVIEEADIRAGRAEQMLVDFLNLAPEDGVELLPKRGMHLKVGDVVSPHRGEAFRILHIEEDDGVTCSGVWQDMKASDALPEWKRRSRFELLQLRFYTTFVNYPQGERHVV